MARRENSRRAMSLLELMSVVAVLALVTLATASYYGHGSLGNGGAEGFTRKIALALVHARRATISTGDNHFLQLTPSTGNANSFALIRRTSGGDVQVDESRSVPTDVTVTSTNGELEFDFEGSSLAAYTVTITGPDRSWTVSTVPLTGAVQVTETTP